MENQVASSSYEWLMLRFFRKRKRKLVTSRQRAVVAKVENRKRKSSNNNNNNNNNSNSINLTTTNMPPSQNKTTTHPAWLMVTTVGIIIIMLIQILQANKILSPPPPPPPTTIGNLSNYIPVSKFTTNGRQSIIIINPHEHTSVVSGWFEASRRSHLMGRHPNPLTTIYTTGSGKKMEADPITLTTTTRISEQNTPMGSARFKRASASGGGGGADHQAGAANSADSTTQLVAVSGQWVELQCPLMGELLASSSSTSGSSSSATTSSTEPQTLVLWRRNGALLSQLDPRYRLDNLNGSLVVAGAQPKLDEGDYECAIGQRQPASSSSSLSPPKAQPYQWPPAQVSQRGGIHRFQLKLLVSPRLAPFDFPQDAQVGMKLVVTCSALEGQQPISFVWLKDNQIILAAAATGSSSNGAGEPNGAGPDNHAHKQQTRAHLLGQVHRQQLADKLALSSPSSSSRPNNRLPLPAEVQQSATSGGGVEPEANEQLITPLSLLSDPNIRVRQSDDYSILSIERLELKHSGRYTCSAQNEAARASHSSQLLINAPPSLTIEPQDGDLVSGQSSVIDCAASGQPRPTVSWLRSRESSPGHWDYVPVYDNLRYTTLTNGSLAIANVTQREQGHYLCSAKNGFGPEVTKLIKITVHEPAKFSSKYQTVEVRIDERANMVCAASGELPIRFEWLDKDGNAIQKNDKRFIIDHDPQDIGTGSANLDELANKTISRLMLTRSGRIDSGHYTCQASNKHGSDKMIINLLVQDVPDKVTDLKVTNVTSTTISVRWQLAFNGNSPITSYLVQYQSDDPLDDLLASASAQTPSVQHGANQQQSLSSGSTQRPPQASMLLASTSQNQLGIIDGGGGGGSGGGATSAQLQQSAATSALRAALDALNIASSLELNADEAIDRTLVELTVEQSSTHLVVKDLSPYCVYRLRLAGINRIGLGEFSDWIRAKTEEAPPGGSALKIQATATGPNSIKVTWSPPDRRSWNGQLIGFNLGYRPIDSGFELNKTIEWSPPSFQSIMLDADEKRRRQMAATAAAATATTHQNQQAEVAASELAGTTSGGGGGGQQLDARDSQRQRGGGSAGGGKQATGGAPSQHTYILRQHLRQLLALQQQELVAHLTNLQRSTTYLVWIQAVNQRGFGPQSHAISIKTLDDVPPSAPAIKIQSASTSSITVAWSMLSNFVSPANQYSLFYRRMPQQQQQQQQQQQLIQQTASMAAAASGHGSRNGFMNPLSGSNSSSAYQPDHHTMSPESSYHVASTGGHLLLEPGPFVERTMTSQQLMVGENFIISADSSQHHDNQALSSSSNSMLMLDQHHQQQQVKPSLFMHQQSQNYQQFVYTLDQLECGSVYELYMTTRNSVGKSEPSPIVTTRTLGEPPLAPANKNNLFAKIGANDVSLNLAAWSTGGCPITHITARYKQVPQQQIIVSTSSSSSSNNPAHNSSSSSAPTAASASASSLIQQPLSLGWPITTNVPASTLASVNALQLQPNQNNQLSYPQPPPHKLPTSAGSPSLSDQSLNTMHQLKSLMPSTAYELEVIAYNAAGHTSAQYEFVTSNANGSRAGFSRKEGGVYRMDQRGNPLDHLPSPPTDGGHRPLEQQPFTNQSGSGAQLLPLILMMLCFVCLIISSAFCYNRLTDSWKRTNGARRSSMDTASGGRPPILHPNCNRRSSQANNISGSPMSKSSMVWRLTNHHDTHPANTLGKQQQQQQQQLQYLGGNGRDLIERMPGDDLNDSPSTVAHYCMREQAPSTLHQIHLDPPKGGQYSSSFSQSVSMKDFNLALQATAPSGGGSGAAAAAAGTRRGPAGFSSTLNFRGRHRSRGGSGAEDGSAGKMLAGTLRHSRFLGGATDAGAARDSLEGSSNQQQQQQGYDPSLLGQPMCSLYSNGTGNGDCNKQQQQQKQLVMGSSSLDSGHYAPVSHGTQKYDLHPHPCSNYTTVDNHQSQQETSWTNYGVSQPGQYNMKEQQLPTGYAIPATAAAAASNYNGHLGTYQDTNQQQLPDYAIGGGLQDNYNQSNIDACIQQLMSQQYQQQHQDQNQQQQYAVIINQKANTNLDQLINNSNLNNKCSFTNGDVFSPQVGLQQPQQLNVNQPSGMVANGLVMQNNNNSNCNGIGIGAQSMIDSSSSSSGIDVGGHHHLDCVSTTTGTSNSNASNNGYQLAQAACDQDHYEMKKQQEQNLMATRAIHEIDLKQI